MALLRSLSVAVRRVAFLAVLTSLLTTGLVLPAQRAGPVLESRAHRLADGPVRVGFQRTVDTDIPTQLVGFRWDGQVEGAVEVRVRGRDGAEWIRIEGDPYEAPDPGSREFRGRTAAGPVWIGPGAHTVDVRVVEGELSGLELHAIRSEEPRARPGSIRPGGAVMAQPGMISRAAWGANESFRTIGPGCNGQPEFSPVRFAVVHHTAGTNAYGPGDSAAIIRGIYHFHTHTNGWCDIGYNFVIDRFGRVFEGRYGGVNQSVVGAHASGFNYGSTGIAVMGTFQTDPMPNDVYPVLQDLLAWKLELHGVRPDGQVQVSGRTIPTIVGHRDVNPTECPGNNLQAWLPRLRGELRDILTRVRLVAVHSGKSMDIAGVSTANGAGVVQWTSHGLGNQQFYLDPVDAGVFRIVASHSGKVLDIAGFNNADGAELVQWDWHGGPNQRWRLESLGGSDYRIVSVMNGKALDVAGALLTDGARLIMWPPHGGANQQWRRTNP